ncbi:MAG: ATP-binding protein [Planctomycetota bacterium]
MIIERILAQDFMRFRSLDLRGFPSAGAVAIVGPNESGKSAIGEAICFALFGATPRASRERAHRAIRWGASSSRVEIHFSIPGAGRYAIVREMDREGGNHARLRPADEEVVLAEGVEEVGKELFNLLGFRFDEFRYSFYLAQNELDLLDVGAGSGARRVIYKMLGIDVLEQGISRVRAELETLNRSFRADRAELKLSRALLESTGFDPEEAETRTEEIARLREQEESRRGVVEEEKVSLEQLEKAHQLHIRLSQAFGALRARVRLSFLQDAFTALAERTGAQLAARLGEKEEAASALESRRRQHEETARHARELERLTDLTRIRREQLRQELTPDPEDGAGGAEGAVSRTEELEEAHARLASSRRRRWTAGIQLGVALLVTVLCAVAALKFGAGEGFLGSLGEILSPQWRMPAALTVGGFALVLSLVFAVRLVLTGRSLARRRRFRDRLEVEVNAMKREAEALEGLHAGRSWQLKSALPFLKEGDLREQGKRVLSEFPDRAVGDLSDGAMARIREERDRAERGLEEAETRLRRLANLVGLLERRTEDLFAGRPDEASVAEGAEPASPAEDLDGLEGEITRLLDSASEVHNQLVVAEREGEDAPPLDALWEEGERVSSDLIVILRKAVVHVEDPDFARFRRFVADADPARAPTDFVASLEEELGRLRSVFPAGEELERRREKVLYDLEQEMAKLAALSARCEGLGRESKRMAPQLEAHEELVKKVDLLETRLGPMEHDLAVRRALVELFGETVTNVKNRFGPAIGRLVGRILPKITKERYGKVQVTADLDISVFSRERNDFAYLEEVSGGTRDQVLASLRLGLAQALLHARMGGDRRQFMFLDEPISSFDEERSLLFLDLVKNFSENFEQIFVTIHMVGSTPSAYEGIVQTSLEEDQLDIDLS